MGDGAVKLDESAEELAMVDALDSTDSEATKESVVKGIRQLFKKGEEIE